MIKKRHILFVTLLLNTSMQLNCCRKCRKKSKNPLYQMENDIEKMSKKIDKIFSDDFDINSTKKINQIMQLKENNNNINISFPLGKGIKKFEANIESESLFIKIPARNLNLHIKYDKPNKYLSIATEWTFKKYNKKNNVKEKYSAQESIQHGQTIKDIIQFKKTKVEYEKGVLSVIIPKNGKKKKEYKKIEVNIK